jgi:hypothetical protein
MDRALTETALPSDAEHAEKVFRDGHIPDESRRLILIGDFGSTSSSPRSSTSLKFIAVEQNLLPFLEM